MADYFKINSIKKIVGVIILIIFVIVGFFEYKKNLDISSTIIKPTSTNIQVKKVKSTDVIIKKIFIGNVIAINSVNLIPQVSGYINTIVAKGGQYVVENQTILTINPNEYKALVASAFAKVLSAAASLYNAKNNYERMRKAGINTVSEIELENARTKYLVSISNFQEAKANYQKSKIDLSYTVISAPFSGYIGNINASVGDYIDPQKSNIVNITQYDPIRVVFSLTDKEYLQNFINVYQKGKIKLILADGSTYSDNGNIEYTSNFFNKTTNSLAIYAKFSNPNKKLLPNSYVKVVIENKYKNIVLIDKNLVQFTENGDFIYTVENGILKQFKIKILGNKDDKYVVENNFDSNEYIVSEIIDDKLLNKKVEFNILEEEK